MLAARWVPTSYSRDVVHSSTVLILLRKLWYYHTFLLALHWMQGRYNSSVFPVVYCPHLSGRLSTTFRRQCFAEVTQHVDPPACLSAALLPFYRKCSSSAATVAFRRGGLSRYSYTHGQCLSNIHSLTHRKLCVQGIRRIRCSPRDLRVSGRYLAGQISQTLAQPQG